MELSFKKVKNSYKLKAIILNNIIFYFFKLSGIATMSIDSKQSYETKNLKWSFVSSRASVLYNICLIFLLIAMHVTSYEGSKKTGFGGRFGQDKSVIGIFDSIIMLGAVLILGTFCVKQKEAVIIANEMSKIANSKEIHACFQNNYLTWFCFGNILMFFKPNAVTVKPRVSDIIYTIVFRSSIFIIISLLIQYSIIIKLIHNFCCCFNKNFLQFLSRSSNFYVIKSIYKANLNSELDNFMHSYLVISKLSRKISDFYSLPMLGSLLAIFVDGSLSFSKEILYS